MEAHNTYKIFPKAIGEFISNNYDLNTINFGNIQNNVKAILNKLELDDVLKCEWEIFDVFFLDKKDISKNDNRPSDFDEYSNFKFTFSLVEGKSYDEFEKAINKLEQEFIFKYQYRIADQYNEIKKEKVALKKKKERLFYIVSGIVFVVLAVGITAIKMLKG